MLPYSQEQSGLSSHFLNAGLSRNANRQTDMKHSNTRALYDYWNKLRRGNIAPQRGDINPSEIKWLLPSMFILEFRGEDNFPITLAGTHLCDHYDRELRDLNLCNFWHGQECTSLARVLHSVVEEGAVGVIGFNAYSNNDRSLKMEMIAMPLRSPAGKPPRIIGNIAAFEKPAWAGRDDEKIVRHDISSLRVLWPDKETSEQINVSTDAYSSPSQRPSTGISESGFTAVRHLRVIDGGRRK